MNKFMLTSAVALCATLVVFASIDKANLVDERAIGNCGFSPDKAVLRAILPIALGTANGIADSICAVVKDQPHEY